MSADDLWVFLVVVLALGAACEAWLFVLTISASIVLGLALHGIADFLGWGAP